MISESAGMVGDVPHLLLFQGQARTAGKPLPAEFRGMGNQDSVGCSAGRYSGPLRPGKKEQTPRRKRADEE